MGHFRCDKVKTEYLVSSIHTTSFFDGMSRINRFRNVERITHHFWVGSFCLMRRAGLCAGVELVIRPPTTKVDNYNIVDVLLIAKFITSSPN